MVPQAYDNFKEFIGIHHEELLHHLVAKTYLFSDYVGYCNVHGYEHHMNLVQFFRGIEQCETSVNYK